MEETKFKSEEKCVIECVYYFMCAFKTYDFDAVGHGSFLPVVSRFQDKHSPLMTPRTDACNEKCFAALLGLLREF